MRVVALAGGVGGAKLVDGLARLDPKVDLTVIVNTGDDFEHFGLAISPDLDTVCYTLAGLANVKTGWGRVDETWQAMDGIAQLGGPTWFRLGDRDLATHLERTRLLRSGLKLSEVTARLCQAWGVGPRVLPMSDEPVRTVVLSDEGELPFQDYFVRRSCRPQVEGFLFTGLEAASPAPGVLIALEEADGIVICPSNPWVSIDPILALPGIRERIRRKKAVAVSPIVGGKALKGPAGKMFAELGIVPSAFAVAEHYEDLLAGIVIDTVDSDLAESIESLGLRSTTSNTIMTKIEDRRTLASVTLAFVERIKTG